jgi:phosphopantetheinyl transferase
MRRPGHEGADGAAAPWTLGRLRAQDHIAVAADEVVYLYVALTGAPERADEALLDEAERRRARRFVRPEHGRRFVLAHAGLRLILARCLGIAPEAVRYAFGPHGKPALTGAAGALEFNLSHADEVALIAVSRGRQLGVDVERVRTIPDALAIADAHFSAAEREALRATPAAARPLAFLRTWTRKEALLKANGEGFGAGGTAPGRLWALGELAAPRAHVAAGAVEAAGAPVRWRAAPVL